MDPSLRLSIFICLLLALLSHRISAQEATVRLFKERAEKLAESKQFSEAVQLEQLAVSMLEKETPPDQEEIVGSFLAISRYFRREGLLDSSYHYLRVARQRGEEYLEPDDPMLSDVYNTIGIHFYYLGNCQEALKYYQLALERRIMCFGILNPRIADSYNNLAICHDVLGQHEEAIENYQKALGIRLLLFDECSPPIAESYLNIGVGYHYLSDYDKALEYYEKALAIWEETLPPDHPDFALIFNNMGVCYQNKGDYRRAQEILAKNLRHSLKANGPDHFEVANAYNNLGLNFYDQGDFGKALVYFEKALAIRQRNFEETHPLVASLYNNIGNCYRKRKDFSKAIYYCQRGLEIRLGTFGPNHREVADSYKDLGLYYEAVGDYAQALVHYGLSLEIDRKMGKAAPGLLADSYLRMGRCYFLQADTLQARSYFGKALKIKEAILGEHPEVAEICTELARCYSNEPEKGLAYIDRALKALRMDQAGKANQIQVTASLQVLRTLTAEGELQIGQYKRTGESNWLEQAHSTFQMARRVVERTRRSYQEPGSKQLLLDQFFEIFEHSIEVDAALYALGKDPQYLAEALDISENSKNVLLNEAVQKAHADQFAGIPPALVQRESDLQRDIGFYENQLFAEEQRGKEADRRLLDLFRDKVFDRKNEYYNLLDTIALEYPEYYELRYGKPDFSLAQLQAKLSPKRETLIEYFLGDEKLFLFVVNPDTIALLSLPAGESLGNMVRELRRQIDEFDPLASNPASARSAYIQTARGLFEWLLAPAVPFFQSTSLTIVPDGLLGYLPFECLLTGGETNGSWKSLPYLIRDYQVSYQYAAGLLVSERPDSDLPPKARMLALAPEFLPGGKLQPLRFNREEVKTLRKRVAGKFLLGAEATEDQFRKLAGQYRVIHLATHAQANDTIGAQSYLAFSQLQDTLENEFLFLRDLYNMRLNADLVVLSACETGMGEWQRGEGIVSLGRGFLYAGAKSIVTTLWSIDDEPSSLIMDGFYAHLKEGLPKDEALRMAKLDYLEENSALRAHPLFWAAFIPLGDMQPVPFQEKTSWWLVRGIALLAGLLLAAWVFRFRHPVTKSPRH
ncbi:MAG: tetratricopeptide repeat protein [Saprospirales bacterium]|nr:tetratricopeptide repeat protein [Saprospirales bacterium]